MTITFIGRKSMIYFVKLVSKYHTYTFCITNIHNTTGEQVIINDKPILIDIKIYICTL